jgi:hypothetical protein
VKQGGIIHGMKKEVGTKEAGHKPSEWRNKQKDKYLRDF